MKNRILLILSIALPLTVACQKSDDTTPQNGTVTNMSADKPQLVRTADDHYVVAKCMSANAADLNNIAQSRGMAAARAALLDKCDVRKIAPDERKRACRPTCYVGATPWTSYYYPPAYYNNSNNTNINLTFNNYFFGGGYNFNGYEMLGYNPQQNYNPYPPGYQPYPTYNPQIPYNYSNYNYGNSYQPGQPFYLNTPYYNPAPNNQFCNTTQYGANTCWFGSPTQNFASTGTTGGATVIQ